MPGPAVSLFVDEEPGRRGSIVGALVLALVGACVASPAAAWFAAREQRSLAAGLAVLFVVLVPLAYLLTALMGRDAERLLDRIAERRRSAALWEARLAATPLPFDVDGEAFAALVEAELAALPGWVRRTLHDTGTTIELAEQREGAPFVLGLYSRRPVPGPALVGGGANVDVVTAITLYRRPLIRAAGVPERLPAQVRETVLHEVGHLVGMAEADLDRYSIGNDPRPDAIRVNPQR